AGGSVTLNVSGGTTYTWTPASSLSNANSPSPVASPTANTVYSVTATSAAGCVSTSPTIASVTVNPIPTLSLSPSSTYTMCSGLSVGLSVSGALSYTWSPATGLSNANSATPTASPGTTTDYTVIGTDANGCSSNASTVATVSVSPSPTLVPTADFSSV